jgi:uncharacterized protein YgfB (UPF0149 family)
MDVMRGDLEDTDRSVRALMERIILIESDTRAEDALEATKDIAELSQEVGQMQKDLDEGLAELNARLEKVAEMVRLGVTSCCPASLCSSPYTCSTCFVHKS